MRKYIEEELAKLEASDQLTPNDVVRVARDPANVLHEEIFFDTPEDAAEEAYLHRARRLIKTVKLTITTTTTIYNPCAYVRNPSLPVEEQGYVSLVRLSTDKERAEQALRQEISRIESSAHRAISIAAGLNIAITTADVAKQAGLIP